MSAARSIGAAAAVTFLALAAAGAVHAQTIQGQISGVVTDASRAVLPGVTVTVVHERTGLTRAVPTDERGAYVVTNLPVGPYTVAAELAGFKIAKQTGFELTADGRLTANFSLDVGDVAESVDVTAVASETVNTTSGEIARVIDGAQVRDLALNGRNYVQLASLIPGAALLNDDQLDLTTSLSVSNQSINGSRASSNSLLVDGGSNLDSGSNASQINNVGIDFIQEVKIQTSNFSAEYGRNSGAAINVVTRSGTNSFSGSVFEFFRNDKLDAANYFAAIGNDGKRVKGKLRFNDFGGALGGPIRRNRAFFFVGQEYKYIRRQTNPTRRTMPTTAELAGNFSQRLAGADRIPGTADDGVLRDPLTGAAFAGNVIPSGRITADGRALAAVYARMIQAASGFTDTPTGNNATFQLDNPFDYRQDIVRLDYTFNASHSIYGRYLHDMFDLIEPLGTFSGSDLPTTPTNRLRPGTSYQLAHNWVVRSNLVNSAKINAAWNGQRIPPVGDTWQRSSYGFGFPQLFPGGRFDGIPNVDVSGFANFRGPSFSLLSPTTDIAFTNTVTWITGAHSVKVGAHVIRNRKDQNGRSNYLGLATFNTAGNPNSTGTVFGDVLLGNFRNYSEASDDPLGFFRFTQIEGFLSDNWRIGSKLSLEAGVRYQWGTPIYSQQNNLVNFDPARYDPARAVRLNPNGTLVPNSGDRFNGLVRAGDGVPEDEIGRVSNATSPEVLAIPDGAPRGLYDAQHLFAPRVSFAYAPSDGGGTSIRGGVGMFYDRPEGNIVFSSLNLPPFLQNVQFENGNLANPSGGTPSALAPLAEINTIDPNLKTAYQVNYSLSVQRELPGGYFMEVAYVGNRGRNLLRFPDINQATFEALAANAALPAAQRLSVNALRPYKGYSSIRQRLSDSVSNYNGLQVYATKRKGDLTLTASYTLSKAKTDASGFGDNPEDPFNREFNYGPATYDRRHIFVATYTYRLPFFLDRSDLLGAIAGGWEISGITRLQSGPYLTVTGNTSIGTRRADYLGGEIALDSDARDTEQWFNTAAFATAPDTRRGNSGVGNVQGPGRHTWDASLRKKFRVTNDVRLGVELDVFNVWNTLNLNIPNVIVTNTEFGRISSAGPARQVQLGVRVEF